MRGNLRRRVRREFCAILRIATSNLLSFSSGTAGSLGDFAASAFCTPGAAAPPPVADKWSNLKSFSVAQRGENTILPTKARLQHASTYFCFNLCSRLTFAAGVSYLDKMYLRSLWRLLKATVHPHEWDETNITNVHATLLCRMSLSQLSAWRHSSWIRFHLFAAKYQWVLESVAASLPCKTRSSWTQAQLKCASTFPQRSHCNRQTCANYPPQCVEQQTNRQETFFASRCHYRWC